MFLKVKIKSLADEAKIIRLEETRNKRHALELREHRIGIVRSEQRHTLIAYAFIRGRSYKSVEPKSFNSPSLDKIWTMVKKYGLQTISEGERIRLLRQSDLDEYKAKLEQWLKSS